jgi:hypothetical protein
MTYGAVGVDCHGVYGQMPVVWHARRATPRAVLEMFAQPAGKSAVPLAQVRAVDASVVVTSIAALAIVFCGLLLFVTLSLTNDGNVAGSAGNCQ